MASVFHHTAPLSAPSGDDAQVYYSLRSGSRLILFVHGYNGDYNTTWNEFQGLIRQDERFADHDIVYYGYPSRSGQIGGHTTALLKFIRSILVDRLNYRNPVEQDWRGYENIVVVAHSMGAVLARKAMLIAHGDHENWIDNTRMVLFAPAHHGTGVPKTVIANIHWIARAIAALLSSASKPIAELDTKLSDLIPRLIADTKELLERGEGEFTRAFSVIWAKDDLVVTNDHFGRDALADERPEHTHQSICKPKRSAFPLPFDKLVEAITTPYR